MNALVALLVVAQAAAGEPASPPLPALTLAQALDIARAHAPQLRQARASAAAAEARADQARAPLLPQLSAQGAYQRATGNFVPRPGVLPSTVVAASNAGTSWRSHDYWTGQLAASQLIYDFGQTTGRYRAARDTAQAQRDTAAAALAQTLLDVRTAYYAARAARDMVGVARQSLASAGAHRRQTEGFVAAGTHPEIDLAQARATEASAQVALIRADNTFAVAKVQLNVAMGRDGPADYRLTDDLPPPVAGEDGAAAALLDEALRSRPDLGAVAAEVRAQRDTVSSVRGGYLPALGVTAAATDAGPELGQTVWNWNAALTLSWDLFQGGLTRAQVREARATLTGLDAQAAGVRQQIGLDVEQARLAVRAGKGALGAAEVALTNAREQLRLAEGRYQAGAGSMIELGDAQVAESTAGAQRVQAEYDLATARAQLLRAVGRE
jgi:outer membrane protein